ncbi:hypothetical protein SAMN05421636_1033 [Pricia antarctica]|uniref:Uncharacterized protein n=1 Tax=Pricia antarctica TaxID=641691 RepID=A0A1G6ZM89_9FLAO|nr:hypothetical protein [Pricia antarctica]SDE03347.1 hypothetical protein SAMN05421636_1033 [Pricia antarctica]
MKKATTYLGILFLGTVLTSFSSTPDCKTNCEPLPIDTINYIEPTEEVALDFDTKAYLPDGFDAYKGMDADISKVVFIEKEEEMDLGFNTAFYLPIDFDAYKGMELNLEDVVFIEDEEAIELDFNVQNYLPENFNAYSR